MISLMQYWLLKTEPDTFSFDDLKKRPKKTEPWNGVRNYQVRNMMRDDMKVGDLGLLYHSSCPEPGVAGVVKIVSAAKPDPTQFDEKSEYYDKGSKKEEPRWLLIDVKWEADLKNFVSLEMLRNEPRLAELITLKRGNRLSVTPVDKRHFEIICKLGGI